MSFEFMSLASSSKGNSYLVKSDESIVLVDLGISFKRIKDILGLKDIALNLVSSVFITHEHSDHIKSLKMILKKMPWVNIYLSRGTIIGIRDNSSEIYDELLLNRDRVKVIKDKDEVKVGDIMVRAFSVSHDTNEPLMYSFKSNNRKLSIVTDTGIVTDDMFNEIKDSNTLVIESNHEPDILLYGSYPYMIKKRILSDYGHLSNELCAQCLCRILKENKGINVFLAHLSENNNTPVQAHLTVENMLEEEGYLTGRDLKLTTLMAEENSKVIKI